MFHSNLWVADGPGNDSACPHESTLLEATPKRILEKTNLSGTPSSLLRPETTRCCPGECISTATYKGCPSTTTKFTVDLPVQYFLPRRRPCLRQPALENVKY